MIYNTELNEYVKSLRELVEDALRIKVLLQEDAAELSETLTSLSAFAWVSAPLTETTRLVEYATQFVGEEISHCIDLSDCCPVRWNSERSYGLVLLQSTVDAAAAEILSRHIGFRLTFVDEEYVFVVCPEICDCEECVERFDVDDAKDLLAFLREYKKIFLEVVTLNPTVMQ